MSLFNFRKRPTRLCALHIDDSRWIRIPVSVVLRRQFGMRVLEASNGPDGVRIAVEEHPDLIILDLMMPHVDGFDTLAQLKANEETKDIPVLICTARNQTRDVNLAIQLGALGYITKPIDEDNLIHNVQQLLVSMGKWNQVTAIDKSLTVKPWPEEKIVPVDPRPLSEPRQPSAPVRAEPPREPIRSCPSCQRALTWIRQYSAWYCYSCRTYPDPKRN